MKRVYPEPTWPPSWRYSYPYDLVEIYGEINNKGYYYAYRNRRNATFNLLREAVPLGSSVLDIAAAQGNFSLALAELGYCVTWNDLRAELEGYVRQKYEYGELSYAPGNAFELAFDHLFDAVLITEVIEHVAHPDEFLEATARLVRPGGCIIMTTPNGGYFRNTLPRFSDCEDPRLYESIQFGPNSDSHIFLLHCDEVQAFASSIGLEIEKMRLFNNPLTSGHVKLGALLNVLPDVAVRKLESFSRRLPFAVTSRLMAHMAVRFRVPTSRIGC